MFSLDNSTSPHGATKGPISGTLTGSEMPFFLRHGRPGGSLSALHCDSIINYAGQDERFAFISTLGHIRQDSKIRSWNRFFQAYIFEETLFTTGEKHIGLPEDFFSRVPQFSIRWNSTKQRTYHDDWKPWIQIIASASFFRFLKIFSTSFMDLIMLTKIFLPNSRVW